MLLNMARSMMTQENLPFIIGRCIVDYLPSTLNFSSIYPI